MDFLLPVRDRVLRNAALTSGETLLDIGAGDGLIAFGAVELVGGGWRAGFGGVELIYEARIAPGSTGGDETTDWETRLRSEPNPLAPTLGEAMAEALTGDEAERFAAHLRPLVESGRRRSRDAVAYLWAVK